MDLNLKINFGKNQPNFNKIIKLVKQLPIGGTTIQQMQEEERKRKRQKLIHQTVEKVANIPIVILQTAKQIKKAYQIQKGYTLDGKMLVLNDFTKKYNLQQRINMFQKANKQRPDCRLTIISRDQRCKVYGNLQKNKFYFPKQAKFLTVSDQLRKHVPKTEKHDQGSSFFIFAHRKLPSMSDTVESIWLQYKNPEDNILYLTYTDIQCFGCFEY